MLDWPFSSSEQTNAVRKLALAAIAAFSFHALESQEFRDFFTSLRKDFVSPSRYLFFGCGHCACLLAADISGSAPSAVPQQLSLA